MNIISGQDSKFTVYETIKIQDKMIEIPPPDPLPGEPYVLPEGLEEQTLAAWLELDGNPALHFRLYGPPGTGKNAAFCVSHSF